MAYIGNSAANQTFTPIIDTFNGNGSTTAFTLTYPVASVAQVEAYISNVPQQPGVAYTVLGNTITFTSAPPSGTANIYVRYTSPITQIMQPGQGTVGTAQMMDAAVTAAKIANTTITPDKLTVGAISWDSSGRVTMPYQPAFMAITPGYVAPANSVFTFSATDFNIGNHFNTSTYRFTAPIAGRYVFLVQVAISSPSNTRIKLRKNASVDLFHHEQAPVSGWQTLSWSVVANLAANDYVDVYNNNGGTLTVDPGPYSTFSGFLIG